jgi:hypothetical protein
MNASPQSFDISLERFEVVECHSIIGSSSAVEVTRSFVHSKDSPLASSHVKGGDISFLFS